jgi:hypothetical protein
MGEPVKVRLLIEIDVVSAEGAVESKVNDRISGGD